MNFNKKALKVAVAAAALSTGAAQAGTWDATSSLPLYATEFFGTGNTTEITPTTAVYTMASGVAQGAAVIDITLAGGTWGTALTAGSMVYANGGNAGTNTISLVDGGSTTESTAQFRVAQGITGTVNDTFTLTYTITGANALATATTTAGPTLAFSITDILGAVDTAGAATAVAGSIEGVTISANSGSTDQIDVTNGSVVFTDGAGNTTTVFDLGDVTVTDNTGAANGVDANDVTAAFTLNATQAGVEGGSIAISGDFAAALALSTSDTLGDTITTTNDGVVLSNCLAGNTNATTLTADTATFTLSAANVQAIGTTNNGTCDFTMSVDGATLLGASTYTATASIDYTTAGLADESFSGTVTTTTKNGSSVPVPLLLNPDGAYDNFLRITNGGTVSGKVFVTLINDAGDTATGTIIDALAAGTSADLISVGELVTAVQASDATFTVGTGKLRGTIEGEFAGIAVQNVSVSTDGTTFFTF